MILVQLQLIQSPDIEDTGRNGSCQVVHRQIEVGEFEEVTKGGRDGAIDITASQPEISKLRQVTKLWGDYTWGERVIGKLQSLEILQQAKVGRDGGIEEVSM